MDEMNGQGGPYPTYDMGTMEKYNRKDSNAVWVNGGTVERKEREKKPRQARKVPKARKEVRERKHLPSAEPSVRETRDVEGKTGTNYQTRGFQHLRHT